MTFSPFLRFKNGVCQQAVCLFVSSFVHTSAMKCTPQPLKTLGRTCLAFLTITQIFILMHADKVSLPRLVCMPRPICTAKKQLDLEAPVFAYICMLIWYIHNPNFISIVNVLDLQFQGQRFE